MEAPSVFLAYRKDDSGGHTGRLYDCLVDRWGSQNVFRDIDRITPGDNFDEKIEQTLALSSVIFVIIGRRWSSIAGTNGKRRLSNPSDNHRREVERALASGRRVIPILVGGAEMPGEAELPQSIRRLNGLHAFELRERDFRQDVIKLAEIVESVVMPPPPPPPPLPLPREETPTAKRIPRILAVLVAITILAIGTWQFGYRKPTPVADAPPTVGVNPSAELSPEQVQARCSLVGGRLVCPADTAEVRPRPVHLSPAQVKAGCSVIGGNVICPDKIPDAASVVFDS